MAQAAIRIEGMKELRAALKKVDDSATDIIAVANKKAATFVVTEATYKAKGMGRQASKASGQLSASGTAKAGTVKLANSKAVPYAIGAEFGANHNVPRPMRRKGKGYAMRGWNGLPVRAKSGRFLWPTIRAKRDEIVDVYATEVDRLLKRTFK